MGGGEIRSYNVLKFLSKKAEVTLVLPAFTICGKAKKLLKRLLDRHLN